MGRTRRLWSYSRRQMPESLPLTCCGLPIVYRLGESNDGGDMRCGAMPWPPRGHNGGVGYWGSAQPQNRASGVLRGFLMIVEGEGAGMTEIDDLSAKARSQAAELNRTLDELAKLGVTASVGFSGAPLFAGPIPVARVRLVLTDPEHKAPSE